MLPVEVGEEYTITTFIQSIGSASFQWLTGPNNEPIDMSNGFEVLNTDDASTLVFVPVRQSQAGRYSCEATVGAITITQEATEIVVNSKYLIIKNVDSGG